MKPIDAKVAEAGQEPLPLTEADLQRSRRTSIAKTVRRALGLTQEEFAHKFHIAVGTLRDWEQSRKVPDQAAQNYLRMIAADPDEVSFVLGALPKCVRGEVQKNPSYYGLERVWFVYRETADTSMWGTVVIPRLPSEEEATAIAKRFAQDHPGVRYGYGHWTPIRPQTANMEFVAHPNGKLEQIHVEQPAAG